MADEININVEETPEDGTAEGQTEETEVDEVEIWRQALEMNRQGSELLQSTMATVTQQNLELSASNARLTEQVAEIPGRIETAVSRLEASILQALKPPPPPETLLSDTSQTESQESAAVVEPQDAEAPPAAPSAERRKRHRTL